MTEEHETPEEQQEQTQHRLLLPLLMPVIIFVFAVLVIYALSRIFLDLSHVEWGDEVNAATPLAIGVMLLADCLVLLITPYVLAVHVQALERLLLQLWPSTIFGVMLLAREVTGERVPPTLRQPVQSRGGVVEESPG